MSSKRKLLPYKRHLRERKKKRERERKDQSQSSKRYLEITYLTKDLDAKYIRNNNPGNNNNSGSGKMILLQSHYGFFTSIVFQYMFFQFLYNPTYLPTILTKCKPY